MSPTAESASAGHVPTLRVGSRSIEFPALPEVMPLLYFGILTLLVAGIIGFTQLSVSIGRLPFWWYLLGLGIIAVVGALAAAHAEDDEIHEGDRVGDDLVAVRAEDWEALQGANDQSPAWVEGEPSQDLDPLVELESLHQELAEARQVAVPPVPEATKPAATPPPARPSALTAALVATAESSQPPEDSLGISSRVPPMTNASSSKPTATEVAALTALTGVGGLAASTRRSGRPRCASCDRDSVPMDPGFRCTSCGRGLCLDCAPQGTPANGPMLCPVCRTFDDLSGPARPTVSGRGSGPGESSSHAA